MKPGRAAFALPRAFEAVAKQKGLRFDVDVSASTYRIDVAVPTVIGARVREQFNRNGEPPFLRTSGFAAWFHSRARCARGRSVCSRWARTRPFGLRVQ